jgi:hypothetical protein
MSARGRGSRTASSVGYCTAGFRFELAVSFNSASHKWRFRRLQGIWAAGSRKREASKKLCVALTSIPSAVLEGLEGSAVVNQRCIHQRKSFVPAIPLPLPAIPPANLSKISPSAYADGLSISHVVRHYSRV